MLKLRTLLLAAALLVPTIYADFDDDTLRAKSTNAPPAIATKAPRYKSSAKKSDKKKTK